MLVILIQIGLQHGERHPRVQEFDMPVRPRLRGKGLAMVGKTALLDRREEGLPQKRETKLVYLDCHRGSYHKELLHLGDQEPQPTGPSPSRAG